MEANNQPCEVIAAHPDVEDDDTNYSAIPKAEFPNISNNPEMVVRMNLCNIHRVQTRKRTSKAFSWTHRCYDNLDTKEHLTKLSN